MSEHFAGWERGPRLPGLHLVTLARYEESLPAEVAFPPMDVEQPLARVISEAGLAQLHAAETEKYPHVTFFFNGGREEPFAGEERVLIPSPKVATYDLQPEMSAGPLTDAVVAAIAVGRVPFRDRQLRERGHGRPHRGAASRDSGSGDSGCLAGPDRGRHAGAGWGGAGDG